jgi:hypothetical protein
MDFTANESKRVHLIAPILWTAIFGLTGSTIEVQKRITGSRLKAHGEFEFMIMHDKAILGIVEAKKDNFSLGLIQNVLGMEVVIDLNNKNSNPVYGIVTNFFSWIFLKDFDDKIMKD